MDESPAFAAWLKETLAARDYGQMQTLMADPFVIAFSVFDPQAGIVRILFVSGWGPEGGDEALLYIAQEPDGVYRWYGVLTAFGGFGQTSTLLAWHREGGIAGLCDDLSSTGQATHTLYPALATSLRSLELGCWPAIASPCSKPGRVSLSVSMPSAWTLRRPTR